MCRCIYTKDVMFNIFSYGDKAPKSFLGRFLTIVWMLSSYLLLSLIAANTTSIISTQHLARIERTIGYKVALSNCISMEIWKGSVNALPKVVAFPRVLRLPPTRNVDRVGWDYHLTDPSTVAVLRHKVAARGALKKPPPWSRWAASFAIQQSFQLQWWLAHA